MKNEFKPDYLVTPGEVVREYMDQLHLTPEELASHSNIHFDIIDGILNGYKAIDASIAAKLSFVLKRPPHFWLNLEKQYQEDKKRLGL